MEPAFFSIITNPPGHETDDLARLLADAGVLDVPTLKLRLRQPAPMVVGRMSQEMAEAGVRAVIGTGGDAFAPTMAEIEAMGGSVRVKRLGISGDDLTFELWRGGVTEVIPKRDVQVLIRAKIGSSKIVSDSGSGVSISTAIWMASPGAAVARAAANYVENLQQPMTVKRETTYSDKIDIHTVDGRVFQLDGDKFGYDTLGDMRGHSDAVNMDRMLELLVHLVPQAIVDRYFGAFRAPVGVDRIRLPRMVMNRDDPGFAFYSRWAALMYRHVMGAQA